jgi:hypothetical protein
MEFMTSSQNLLHSDGVGALLLFIEIGQMGVNHWSA